MEYQFKIFKPKKRFIVSVDLIIYSVLILSFVLILIAKNYLNLKILEQIGQIGLCISFFAIAFFKVAQYFIKKTLNGKFEGRLTFLKDSIIVDTKTIRLDEIKKLNFSLVDYEGRKEFQGNGVSNPAISNGIENYCEILLESNKKLKIQFLLNYENEHLKLKDIFINYYKNGKISFLHLISILNIEKYEKVQEFKKTLK